MVATSLFCQVSPLLTSPLVPVIDALFNRSWGCCHARRCSSAAGRDHETPKFRLSSLSCSVPFAGERLSGAVAARSPSRSQLRKHAFASLCKRVLTFLALQSKAGYGDHVAILPREASVSDREQSVDVQEARRRRLDPTRGCGWCNPPYTNRDVFEYTHASVNYPTTFCDLCFSPRQRCNSDVAGVPSQHGRCASRHFRRTACLALPKQSVGRVCQFSFDSPSFLSGELATWRRGDEVWPRPGSRPGKLFVCPPDVKDT